MKRIPRVGDIVVIMRTCREDGGGCFLCEDVIGRTALVSRVEPDNHHLSLRFQRTTGLRSGYRAHQIHITGLTV